MRDRFESFPESPPDKLMQANAVWKESWADRPDAVNTTIGVLLDPETGAPLRPSSVEQAIIETTADINRRHNYSYLTSLGNQKFLDAARELIFEDGFDDIISFQSVGGTGALSTTKDTLMRLLSEKKPTLVLDPGWPNHQAIFGDIPAKPGFDIVTYPHADFETGTYNHADAISTLMAAPAGSVALFQVSGYNGDGLGRTHEQWDEVLDAAVEKDHVVVLDAAYMGLTGTIEEDSYAINQACERGLLVFINVSFSKNMGLYNERLGALFIVNAKATIGAEQVDRLKRVVADKVIRPNYSNPPLAVAEAATRVLTENREAYFADLEIARNRLDHNRQVLSGILGRAAPIIANGEGLFTTLLPNGFSAEQQQIIENHNIFALQNSRINIGGIHPEKVSRVGYAVLEALESE